LFEGTDGPQIVSELIGRNLALTRKPVTEPGRPGAFSSTELEGRQGARILPEWLDVIDDPTQTEWHGRPLIGHYRVDEEGIAPKPLTLVEKGILKNYFLTRQPMRGYTRSNGHARLPANFGTEGAAASNLFVRARKTTPLPKLKKKMLDLCKARGKSYGIIVRKMDFPSSASVDEARRILASQSGGGRPVSLPVLVYRLYPDGREELVRGLHFKGMNARSLKDIVGVSDESNVFEFLENGAPFALLGGASYAAESSVIAPSLLVDDLELVRTEEEFPRPPAAPPPAFQAAK
jgi:TldD protein